ncbi:MBL fold metallo-hydrolase [Falsibacillus pallidus]|uniref:MBL fold metallo-hydrolase n=1 Tax=Falsibacillus pallidus TaxID=493781 RepID=UPI003D971469
MQRYICKTCGVQYGESTEVPVHCLICEEERQYVAPTGQTWTTLDEMKKESFRNEINLEEAGLYSVKTVPEFAIGQTAYLVQNDGFNLLWDCITFLDEKTINEINRLGGVDAIALSHPHYYSTQVEWAETFDAPIYIHEDDREWVTRKSDYIVFWSGESLELHNGLTIHRLGGHFKGGAVLEWKAGYDGKGILLSGDIIQVVADREWVSFMYSYPNLIPLPASKVKEMAAATAGFKFERLYNAFHRVVKENANERVQKSAERYVKALEGRLFDT